MPFKLFAFHFLEYFDVSFTAVTLLSWPILNLSYKIQAGKPHSIFFGFEKKIHTDLMHNEATKTTGNINSNLGWPSLSIVMELLHRKKKQELIRKDYYLK